ncbi:RDD family protein [Streptomyces sp. BK208]|uniref:RDD family protein n=1 Tax=Streptomyces sp. BK208 TaxID=2512150 RepID=UPI0010EF64F3|nr:RDD family protein [Streptomyces sp. BK208]TDT39963.1 RDD family protein [Streptomyces sp. BK208]
MPGASRRITAWLIDFALVVAVAVLLGSFTFHRISAMITDTTELIGSSAWEVLTSGGHPLDATERVWDHVWGSAVSAVQQAFVALVLITFAYHFAALVLTNRTLGKLLTGLRVSPTGPGALGARRAAIRAGVSTLADVGCFAVACCVLVSGSVVLSVLCWTVAVAVFWANGAPALRGRRLSLADRMAGTTVGNITVPQPDWGAARQGIGQTMDLGLTRARDTRAAWKNAVQNTRDGRERVAGHETLRRVVDSDLNRAAVRKSRVAFDRAKAAATRRRRDDAPPPPPHPPLTGFAHPEAPVPYFPPPPPVAPRPPIRQED